MQNFQLILSIIIILGIALTIFLIWQKDRSKTNNLSEILTKFSEQTTLLNQLNIRLNEREQVNKDLNERFERILNEQRAAEIEFRNKFNQNQLENLKHIIDSLQKGTAEIRNQIYSVLKSNTDILSERLNKLTDDTNSRLKEINNRVEERLKEGFEKTTATFGDIIKRLALIDEAQKNISALSSDVISLKEILADKRSRGAFGEVQLEALIRNVLPEQHFAFQHTLKNNKRADCILFLPEPTGNIVIDSKFPLESYQRLSNFNLPETERQQARQQFKRDIQKHIQDIAEKYIIEGETANSAVMFIPAEAIFAEIHAHYADLVEISHRASVWITSPTTMMAILNTIKAVLKDAATRKQAHLIQEHLLRLKEEFGRFQKRMDSLSTHITQVHNDVDEVCTTSKKISSQFGKIEKVELEKTTLPPN